MDIRTTAEISTQTMTANCKEWANIRWIRVSDVEEELGLIID